jgi:hypothetical protein
LLAEIGFADFGGACGASFHFAPITSKEKAANIFLLFNELLFYQYILLKNIKTVYFRKDKEHGNKRKT